MDDEVKELAKKLVICYNEAYDIYEPRVQMIIDNKVKDYNLIENTLDYCLNIYTEKGFDLFMKLLFYYKTVNYYNAWDYYEMLKELREDEYKAFVKKLKK